MKSAAVLAAQPGVAAAAVVVADAGRTWTNSSAFVVPAANGQSDPAQWRQALAARLPAYMVPAHFEIVGRLAAADLRQN